jgi:hypothetical protein
MVDVLLINRSTAARPSTSLYYRVQWVRLKSDVDVNWLTLGMSLKEMLDGSVVEHDEVLAPDGSPPEPFGMGSETISSQNQALNVARAALANPNSDIRRKGLPEDAPIYLWHDGKPAELLSGPQG